jgi:hypothetical protein
VRRLRAVVEERHNRRRVLARVDSTIDDDMLDSDSDEDEHDDRRNSDDDDIDFLYELLRHPTKEEEDAQGRNRRAADGPPSLLIDDAQERWRLASEVAAERAAQPFPTVPTGADLERIHRAVKQVRANGFHVACGSCERLVPACDCRWAAFLCVPIQRR